MRPKSPTPASPPPAERSADVQVRPTSGPAAGQDGDVAAPGQGAPGRRRGGRRRRRRNPAVHALILAFDALVLTVGALWVASVVLAGRDLVLPQGMTEHIDAVLSRGLGGGEVSLGAVVLRFAPRQWPEVELRSVAVTAPDGTRLATAPALSLSLDTAALLRGRIQPNALILDNASVALRRNEDGKVDFGFDTGGRPAALRFGSLDEAVEALKRAFALPALAPVGRIEIAGLAVAFDDLRAGETWRVEDGMLVLEHDAETLDISVSLKLPPPAAAAGAPQPAGSASVALRLSAREDSHAAELSALVEGVPARTIAMQAPTLAWLKPLEAPVSGALIATLTPEGALGAFNGTLEIGAGAFRPSPDALAMAFDGARTYFRYLPDRRRLVFDALSLRTPALTVEATGQADLEMGSGTWPAALLAQIRFDRIVADPPGVFDRPAVFDDGAIDARLVIDPFSVEIGQMFLTTDPAPQPAIAAAAAAPVAGAPAGAAAGGEGAAAAAPEPVPAAVVPNEPAPTEPAPTEPAPTAPPPTGADPAAVAPPAPAPVASPEAPHAEEGPPPAPTRLSGRGRVSADHAGWHLDLLLGIDRVTVPVLIPLWPRVLAPRPRAWVVENLGAGEVTDFRAGLKIDQGRRTDPALSFAFREGEVRPLRGLSPVVAAEGFASLGQGRFAVSLDAGRMVSATGGAIDLAGSTFVIADTRVHPPRAHLQLRAAGPVRAGLEVLDEPAFRFLQKAGLATDIAEGQAAVAGDVRFPIAPGLVASQIDYGFTGQLTGISSDRLVPGKALTAQALELSVAPSGLGITGPATLEGVPLTAAVTVPFGPEAAAPEVRGRVEIGGEAVARLGIGLPEGMVGGRGSADYTLTVPRGAPPELKLESDLAGVTLALAPLGWSMPAAATGRLRATVAFGQPITVRALALDAPGLAAAGRISLDANGGLDQANFDRVALGGWLDAPVTLRGRGADRIPAVLLPGGTVDLRKAPFGDTGGSGGSGGGEMPPISLALDRLVVTDTIALTGFRSTLSGAQGLSGRFEGRVNGAASVSGTVAQRHNGLTLRLTANDAGAALRAAGFFDMARGGSLTLTLDAANGPGTYDGTLKVRNVRVQSASWLAVLLNAISVVGLIDEMNGAGLLFTDVEAAFRLTPRMLEVTRSSAVGPSLGITMQGSYDMLNDRLDMQGVLSPIYVVNAIGQMFTRKGEGLFGFNYALRGRARSPSVEVDPLSVLTPGMFRDLFRTAPPARAGRGR